MASSKESTRGMFNTHCQRTSQCLVFNCCINCTDSTELTIEKLKREMKVTDQELDIKVEEYDLPEVSACFDNTDDYLEKLELSPGQQTDVKTKAYVEGTQTGMKLALKYWVIKHSLQATFRALLLIILSLCKGDVAIAVCKYLSGKGELWVHVCGSSVW